MIPSCLRRNDPHQSHNQSKTSNKYLDQWVDSIHVNLLRGRLLVVNTIESERLRWFIIRSLQGALKHCGIHFNDILDHSFLKTVVILFINVRVGSIRLSWTMILFLFILNDFITTVIVILKNATTYDKIDDEFSVLISYHIVHCNFNHF